MPLEIIRQANVSSLIGATTDSAATDHTSTSSLNGILKAILRDFRARIPTLVNGAIPIVNNSTVASSVVLSSVNVTTTSAVLFAANANRIFWSAEYKSGTGEAFVTEGATATPANGRVITIDTERIQDVPFVGIINVIGTVASGTAVCTLGCTEYIK